jgi:hypoxanthine-DNA glycosylase
MGELLGFEPTAGYAKRTAALAAAGIALWDVVGSCVRPGSLDAAIEDDSIVANDFAAFLGQHRGIARVCFNGRKAESAWRRHVQSDLPPTRKFDYRLLPSTSPAHAGMSYRRKLQVWRSAIAC